MTRDELYTLVQSYLEATETSFVDNLDLFVQLAEEDIYRQVQLPELRRNSTSTAILNSPYLEVPSDYLSTYSMSVIDATGMYHNLVSKEVDFMREVYPDPNAYAMPRFFAQFDGDSYIIAPTPDQEYTIELHYFYKPDSISTLAGSGTTWLSTHAENALLFGTVMHGYIYLKGDQDVMQAYKAQFDKAILDLRTIAEGRIRKDSYRNIDKRLPV
jgi:hypothetical protein